MTPRHPKPKKVLTYSFCLPSKKALMNRISPSTIPRTKHRIFFPIQSSLNPWQHSLHKWSNVPSTNHPDSRLPPSSQPTSVHQTLTNLLSPFGTPLPSIDPRKTLRVCMQNTQHDFKICGDGIEMISIQNHLSSIGISVFAPISPNVNWKNSTNWPRTRQIFRPTFQHVHLSATSSNIGLDPLYLHKHLIGGAAILSFGL
jgi:hypothetical protein